MSPAIQFRAEVFREGDTFVGICPELNVSSFGATQEEAQDSLREAVELFLEECDRMGSLNEILEEAGFSLDGSRWVGRSPVHTETLSIPGRAGA